MSTNQALRQASVEAVTGTALPYNEDWMRLFDQASVPPGPYDGRLLAWINQTLAASFTNLPGAMQAYAASQGFASWDSMGTFTPGGGPVYSPEAQALFNAMTVQPDATRKGLLNTCINSLKSAGVWSLMDVIWCEASHDRQASKLNWPAPAGANGQTEQGGVVGWTQDRGFAGDGVATYLSSPYTPGVSSLATQNDNHMGVWVLTALNSGTQIDCGNSQFSVLSRAGTPVVAARDSAAASNNSTADPVTSVGHIVLNRPNNAANFDIYKNGAQLGATIAQASAGLIIASNSMAVCCRNNAGTPSTFSTRQIALFHMGKSLTALNISDLYTAFRTLFTAMGIP
jgi:hypothetical protein